MLMSLMKQVSQTQHEGRSSDSVVTTSQLDTREGSLDTYEGKESMVKIKIVGSKQEDIEYETDYDLLIMSDMLITDWSTIYVDYLCLDKPIIFLDNPNPNKFANSSVIETLNNKRSKNYDN